MANTAETYQVIAPKGVVVEDGGNSILYQAASTFTGRSNNPSIRRHIATGSITRIFADLVVKPTPAQAVKSGPAGPRGFPGGPAGSLHSCKIRTRLPNYPIQLLDNTLINKVSWPANTASLYDEVGMFDQSVDPEKIFVKAGGTGRYHIVAELWFRPDPVGVRHVLVNHYDSNGNLKDQASNSKSAVPGIDTILPVSGYFNAEPDDYFSLCYQQTSSNTLAGAATFSAMLMGSGPAGPDGPKGDQGDKGDKGDVGLTWLGNWDFTVSYTENDAVSYMGSSFVAVAPNLNTPQR
jgi:hypothetical protein